MDFDEALAYIDRSRKMSDELWKISETLEKLSLIGKNEIKQSAYLRAANAVRHASAACLEAALDTTDNAILHFRNSKQKAGT